MELNLEGYLLSMYVQQIRYTPVGEYLRLLILRRLARGPAKVEEIDKLAEEAVRRLHVRYDWRVWPRLLAREVEVKDGAVELTRVGRWILEQTGEEVAEYVKKTLGVALG
jgi:DNA-binding transcriptional ArsR family regulator